MTNKKTAETKVLMSLRKKIYWANRQDKKLSKEHKTNISKSIKKHWKTRRWDINDINEDIVNQMEAGSKDLDVLKSFVPMFAKLPRETQETIILQLEIISSNGGVVVDSQGNPIKLKS